MGKIAIFRHAEDGSFPKATFYWSRLPAVQHFNFYFFNITNPDEVLYNGAVPKFVEVGPYSWPETEFKDFIEFREDDTYVHYQNNKTWVWDPSSSCDSCGYNDTLMLPNPAFASVIYMSKTNLTSPVMKFLLNGLCLLLGEQPLRAVPMAGVLFTSYDDPFISLINSNFTKTLMSFMGNPIPLPPVPAMGYFPNYNQTNDGDFLVKTGIDNVDNLALIQKWCGMEKLPWFSSTDTADIRNSGGYYSFVSFCLILSVTPDGSFQKPFIKSTDRLRQFQSLACRKFELVYSGNSRTVNGIPAMDFVLEENEYNSLVYDGYRYPNFENQDYFPSWPCNGSHKYNPNSPGCSGINCARQENFCDPCCNGSTVNGQVWLPPGMTPLGCLPAKPIPLPFGGIISPPHFLWSPPEVHRTLGLSPDENRHDPMRFSINPTTGSTVDAYFRVMLSIPVYRDSSFAFSSSLTSLIHPTFWMEINIEMRHYAISYLKSNTVTIPAAILGVGISLIVIFVSIFCLDDKLLRVSSTFQTPSVYFN
ncbi:hypothetical protein WR25_09592 isoform R [Diploscapter pachys]|uniref:CD36 family protein n=2 Tax=Diploscapter pachys TaxID=2018661 RepID=A0A2A2KXG5_9BILA|nr:hypothetical protein WR25_09592 isoform R [Diploscapter pachys]